VSIASRVLIIKLPYFIYDVFYLITRFCEHSEQGSSIILFYPIFQSKSSKLYKKIERSWVHNFSLGDFKKLFNERIEDVLSHVCLPSSYKVDYTRSNDGILKQGLLLLRIRLELIFAKT